jgi:hypothetical protein
MLGKFLSSGVAPSDALQTDGMYFLLLLFLLPPKAKHRWAINAAMMMWRFQHHYYLSDQ